MNVTVVTGGTGGVGLQLIPELAADGPVCFSYRSDHAKAESLLAEISDQQPESASYCLDVADPAAVSAFGESLGERYGRVAALVNLAGISNNSDPVADIPVEAWQRIIQVNLTGTFLVCKAVIPLLEDGGRVVNTGSIFGHHSPAQRAAYGASKHGVIGLTQALAHELAPRRITVNAVCPGGIRSPMQERMWQVTAEKNGMTLEEFREFKLSKIPLHRVCEPADVTAAIRYLLGPGGAFITGTCIDLTGGAL
jgi:NAD(P)-dependent dehydrogenase (short-subunit alcohol dehydrogenase family)